MAKTSQTVVGAADRRLHVRAKPNTIARMSKHPTIRDEFLAEIEAFLEREGITDTRFSMDCMGDYSWLARFRAGSDPKIGTVDHVRRFMLTYRKRPKMRACARACA